MNITTVLFDLDGTLTDPGLGITNSVMHALRKLGVEPPEREALYKFIGPPLKWSFHEYYGFDDAKCEEALLGYRSCIPPFPACCKGSETQGCASPWPPASRSPFPSASSTISA